jgi:hypothetical protein
MALCTFGRNSMRIPDTNMSSAEMQSGRITFAPMSTPVMSGETAPVILLSDEAIPIAVPRKEVGNSSGEYE